jgi:hypothetical protein
MSFKITTCPDTYLFILYMVFHFHIYMVERKFNNDGYQFHQYHQNEQSFLILNKDLYSKKDRNLGRFSRLYVNMFRAEIIHSTIR